MKYNDNGTYKDIYVKAFDTLPVGTEVDYDGETVPTGWSEVDEKGKVTVSPIVSADQTITGDYLTDMEVSITTTGGDILILTSFIASITSGTGTVTAYVDGVSKGRITTIFGNTLNRYAESKIISGIEAGTHTVKIYAVRDGSGTNTISVPKYYGRSLSVVEL